MEDAGRPARLTGYQVNNEVSVRLEDVSKLGGALDALARMTYRDLDSERPLLDNAELRPALARCRRPSRLRGRH